MTPQTYRFLNRGLVLLRPQRDMVAVELYDNQADPDENVSIAGFPENALIIRNLAGKLKAGWKGALIRK